MFPWLIQQDNEKPSDDSGPVFQNDNTPSSLGRIYSFDPPGTNRWALFVNDLAYKTYRATFKEFVRMKINNSDFITSPNSPNELEGSRLSPKLDWYVNFQVRRFSNGFYKMELDTADVSVSFPIKESLSNSNGNVTLSISDPGLVTTNGYEMIFNANTNVWEVKRIVNGTTVSMISIVENPVRTWSGNFEGVLIQITQGSWPFINTDRYTYSTFATQHPQGKLNVLRINNQIFDVFGPF